MTRALNSDARSSSADPHLMTRTRNSASIQREPPQPDSADIAGALTEGASLSSAGERIDRISARFLGRPYLDNPLGGGPEQRERLTATTTGFDCVTYVETILALAEASTRRSFLDRLRRIRYREGRVEWRLRNHYMSDWARNNQNAGLIENLTTGRISIRRARHLNIIPGLRERDVVVRCFPKRWLLRNKGAGQTGDVVMLVSTRKNLDFFHLGFVIRRDGERLIRHASRTARAVVEEPLESFLRKLRMSGIVLLRPLCRK